MGGGQPCGLGFSSCDNHPDTGGEDFGTATRAITREETKPQHRPGLTSAPPPQGYRSGFGFPARFLFPRTSPCTYFGTSPSSWAHSSCSDRWRSVRRRIGRDSRTLGPHSLALQRSTLIRRAASCSSEASFPRGIPRQKLGSTGTVILPSCRPGRRILHREYIMLWLTIRFVTRSSCSAARGQMAAGADPFTTLTLGSGILRPGDGRRSSEPKGHT